KGSTDKANPSTDKPNPSYQAEHVHPPASSRDYDIIIAFRNVRNSQKKKNNTRPFNSLVYIVTLNEKDCK
ncbi:MAG: hypothetical protein IJT01_02545, partial [Selenomonadaceae bacterium]|nr:hypothetical protein [Selenomonadaceae bacterium]